ncbi:hypothetical protein CY34DRAFT_804828 [Suillus luteus UH-Slu-Lm8-n1]|uniref:DUF6593 domain-containing protein n=1 Tax=Suillus luteus UH-Slu-Lm8-n1 TaxID=930992 RepID=A0A0C9ZXW1_9AGAM|nr:hypothetical protein CY34DRAFT_804828 [Suillus luteus UH-Slu-Lm8-n1]
MATLTLSTEDVRETVITGTNEQGQILYKTNTPFGFFKSTTTIQKGSEVIAEIEWHSWSSSKLRFNGTEVEAEKFITFGGYLNQKFVFTGPDGRSYRWDQHHNLVLSRNEEVRTEVARYHRATLGIIGKKRKATLEVSPEVAHMMDTIIITFIYIEKLRGEKERRSHNMAGG